QALAGQALLARRARPEAPSSLSLHLGLLFIAISRQAASGSQKRLLAIHSPLRRQRGLGTRIGTLPRGEDPAQRSSRFDEIGFGWGRAPPQWGRNRASPPPPPAASISRSAGSLTKIGAWNRRPHDRAVISRYSCRVPSACLACPG